MTDDNTTASAKKKSLGRGLSALLSSNASETLLNSNNATNIVMLPLDSITPKANQPRQFFDTAALQELADSIRQHGVLQPILVRRNGQNNYDLIAGERRWRAARLAGLQDIPALIRDSVGSNDTEIALIENLQRQDLNPIEEAHCYQRLIEEVGYTQDDLATRLARSRSHVTNYLRLLQLPARVQTQVMQRDLSVGHARALVNSIDPERLAQKVIERGLSVRQLEQLLNQPEQLPRTPLPNSDIDKELTATATYLSAFLGLTVTAFQRRNGSAQLRINIATHDDLTKLHHRLNPEPPV